MGMGSRLAGRKELALAIERKVALRKRRVKYFVTQSCPAAAYADSGPQGYSTGSGTHRETCECCRAACSPWCPASAPSAPEFPRTAVRDAAPGIVFPDRNRSVQCAAAER